MNIATANEEIQFASWEKPFRRHVIKYPSCNIFTQLSGRVGKTYIANRVHSYIENSGIRKIASFTLDNHEAVAELCKSVNLKSMTYREENIPYEEKNGGRWVKKEPIDRSAGKIREIDLVHFDDLFNIILEYKDNANYIIDVPCWATTAFHEYAVSMEIQKILSEMNIRTIIHIPVISSDKDKKAVANMKEIRDMYDIPGYRFFIWRNHFEGKVDAWNLSAHLHVSDTVVDI